MSDEPRFRIYPVRDRWPSFPFPSGMQLCVIVKTPHLLDSDRDGYFYEDDEIEYVEPGEADVLDLLVRLKVFPSKGQARKNWKGPVEIPPGWFEAQIGKRRLSLFVWNPAS